MRAACFVYGYKNISTEMYR